MFLFCSPVKRRDEERIGASFHRFVVNPSKSASPVAFFGSSR